MCMSSPNIPPPPPPPQEAKPADAMPVRRAARARGGMGMGTMLTGPSGVAAGALNTSGTSLLGG
jgi:hypothetical protein